MKATRRDALKGALAMPAVAGLPAAAWARRGGAVAVYDPSLAAGRALAQAQGRAALAIAGDRIRFARALFEARPAWVVGVSRSADALLIADVGHEAGYVPAAPPAGFPASAWALAPRR